MTESNLTTWTNLQAANPTINIFGQVQAEFPALANYGGSVFYNNYMLNFHGESVVFNDINKVINMIVNCLSARSRKYEKMYNVLSIEYKPLAEYSETKTVTESGTDTIKQTGTDSLGRTGTDTTTTTTSAATNNATAEKQVTTFDSDTYHPDEKTTSNATTTGNGTNSTQYGSTDTTTYNNQRATDYGHQTTTQVDGRKTPAAVLVRAEMENALYSLQLEIIRDIVEQCTLSIYFMEG